MNKKIAVQIIKLILELAIFILLVLIIIYLINSNDGVLAQIDKGTASEKLDTAIKTFASTDGMKLDTAIKNIKGLENLEINEETGEYKITIDGQEFIVYSKEIIPEEEKENKEAKVGEKNGQEN